MTVRSLLFGLIVSTVTVSHAARRPLEPDDLFRFERVGAIAWSSDQTRAAVEIHRPSRWLDRTIPTAAITVLDVTSGTLTTVSPSSEDIVGFFGPAWSPENRRLLFLSVDRNAIVRPWVWTTEKGGATLLSGFELQDGPTDPPVGMWSDDEHVLFMLRDPARPIQGPLYFALERGRNVADQWARAREGVEAAVSVLDSNAVAPGTITNESTRQSRIVSVDVRTGVATTIVTGPLHRPKLSPDRRILTYRREQSPLSSAGVATFFGPSAKGDAAYDDVNWGKEIHHVDLRTGVETSATPASAALPPPTLRPALRVMNLPTEGTSLLLSRPDQSEVEVWRGNTWVREIETARAERIGYRSRSGTSLTGWLLYPVGYSNGRPIPIVAIIYPGTVYSETEPRTFDIFNAQLEHPQMFAARGYGVLLPSMPGGENPLQGNGFASLGEGVFPLLDVLIDRGIADPRRVAVIGQSAGGWAALGLLTETNRFRTAIVSAAYSNLVSLYGTFWGQFRYGDFGSALHAQIMRMLQFERAYFGAEAPPWERPERYRVNSPIWRVAKIQTPLMLIHGDVDYIPVQQAEELFTALYRQDKRVRFVRYAGESHLITGRSNVLDFWRRVDDWLRETMPSD